MTYQVIVGNIGTVYDGPNPETALADFDAYVIQSKANAGRTAGEAVTLLTGDEIIAEYPGTLEAE